MAWAVILAVMLYPLQRWVKGRVGNKDGRAATLIVLIGIAVLLVPIYLLGTSIAASAEGTLALVRSGSLQVPPPASAVADLPLVGQPLYAIWQEAATDMTGFAQHHAPEIRALALSMFGKLAGFEAESPVADLQFTRSHRNTSMRRLRGLGAGRVGQVAHDGVARAVSRTVIYECSVA